MAQMNMKSYKTWVEISKKNLLYNLHIIQSLIGKETSVIAVIKANAYGHGLSEIAGVLRKEKKIWCGVDSIDEAILLKNIGIKQPIIILGYIPSARLLEAIQNNFRISVYSIGLFYRIINILKKYPRINTHLHIKIESGTNRLGIQLYDLVKLTSLPPIEGVYTHFADVEDLYSKFYQDQLKILKKAIWILKQKGITPRFVHTASSAALLTHKETYFSLVRLGISLYGLWPFDNTNTKHRVFSIVGLKPVLMWKTRIAQIKEIQKGETVGYDRTWVAKRKTKIAILPVGYYDGYDRRLSNGGEVLISGKRVKIIGRVCMNMMMADITDILAKENDEVVLIGKSGKEEITADVMARKINSINYEIVSRINPLLPRIIV